jgi:hypothetical protein
MCHATFLLSLTIAAILLKVHKMSAGPHIVVSQIVGLSTETIFLVKKTRLASGKFWEKSRENYVQFRSEMLGVRRFSVSFAKSWRWL